MMSAWHLLWIVPLCAGVGYMLCGILTLNHTDDD